MKGAHSVAMLAGMFVAAAAVAQNGLYLVPPREQDGYTSTTGYGLSSDGTTLVGVSGGDGLNGWGFRYTRNGGRVDLLQSLRVPQVASADGSRIGGFHLELLPGPIFSAHLFRQSEANGFEYLARAIPQVAAMSAAGDAMCGYNPLSGGRRQAMVWDEEGGMRALQHFSETIFSSESRDMTADGRTIVGDYNVGLQEFPMRWTEATGMVALEFPHPGSEGSAFAVSPDGRFAVGTELELNADKNLILWDNFSNPQTLAPLGPSETPWAVTNNGLIVGDWAGDPQGAWIWSASTGKISLEDYAASQGVSIDPAIDLRRCNSVSLDGRVFAGYARLADGGTRAYMLVIPSPSVLVVAFGAFGYAARRSRRGPQRASGAFSSTHSAIRSAYRPRV